MKATICIFIFCLIIAFLSRTSSSLTVVETKPLPNVSKGIPREPGIPDSGQSATENERLVFENIIAVHNTYFIVLIAALSVYFGIVGACWKVVFGTNHKAPVPTFVWVPFLGISTIAGVAIFIGMLCALSECTARQKYLNDLADKLNICSQDYLNGLVDNCSIDLSLLHDSVIVSIFVIVILSIGSLILYLYVFCWKGDRHKQAGKIGTAGTKGYDVRYCFDEASLKARIRYVEGHGD